MKASKYNIILPEKDNILLFNTLSRSYLKIGKDKEVLVNEVLNNADIYNGYIPKFCKSLRESGFLVDDDLNELDIVCKEYDKNIESKFYKLVILPTLECNFRCWYCVQDHDLVDGYMSPEVQNMVCEHIKFMIVNKKIESLNIDWFGGEPFKYFKEVIIPISNYAKEICKEYNIPFVSTTTTNGYLVNKKITEQMKDLNFRLFHITLDGNREYHNKIRQAKNESSFDVIIENINSICQSLPQAEILLRINYDNKNLNPVEIIQQIDEKIIPENKKKVRIYFRKIWQIDHFSDENIILNEAKKLLKEKGYKSPTDLILNFVPCYANKKFYNAISYNGNIFKCTAKMDMEKDGFGKLDPKGAIIWKNDNFEEKYSTPLFQNKRCSNCIYLPICMGPCNKKFETNNLSEQKFECKLKNGANFNEQIIAFCE